MIEDFVASNGLFYTAIAFVLGVLIFAKIFKIARKIVMFLILIVIVIFAVFYFKFNGSLPFEL